MSTQIFVEVKCSDCKKQWKEQIKIKPGSEGSLSEVNYACPSCGEYVNFNINGIPLDTDTGYRGI